MSDEWISVKDSLPPETRYYMVCLNENPPHLICSDFYCDSVTYFDDTYGLWKGDKDAPERYFSKCRQYLYKITHWMPLPKPPKGER